MAAEAKARSSTASERTRVCVSAERSATHAVGRQAAASSTIARMSFWLTISSSSPSTLNSVPAYLA